MKSDEDDTTELLRSLEALENVTFGPIMELKAAAPGAVPEDLIQRVNKLKLQLENLADILAPFVPSDSDLELRGRIRQRDRFRRRGEISAALSKVKQGLAEVTRNFQIETQIAAELLLNKQTIEAAEANKEAQKCSNLDILQYATGSNWNPKRTCLAGTRVDLINNLVQLATTANPLSPHRIHLVVGVAGCGKSTIAHSISKACAEPPKSVPRTLGSAFFFSRGVAGRNTPDLLFSSMAYNLSMFHPSAADAVNRVLEKDRKILSQSPMDQFRKLFLLPIASIPDTQLVVIVIDALDEGLGEKSDDAVRIGEEYLDILGEECARLPSNCHIIITSRPEPSIMELRHKAHVCVHEIILDDPHNLDDVALLSRHLLSNIAEKRNLGASWPEEELQNAFIDKAEGLAIWASTVSAFILRAANPAKQLKQLCGDRSSFNLNAEAKMAQLYSTVLAACPWDDEDFSDNYQLLMGTLLTLKTPLSPLAVKSLLDIDISIVDTLRPLSPVLTGVTDDVDGGRPLQIIHDSFRGYSTGRDVSNLSTDERRYAIDKAEHSQRLVLAVLLLLNRELPLVTSTIDNEITAAVVSEDGDIPTLPTSSISEPLWYCCEYLVPHLNGVAKPNVGLTGALREFMGRNLSSWIVLCSSRGTFPGVSAVLARCQDFALNVSNGSLERIARLLNNLSGHLRYMSCLEEALLACREAVGLHRQLAKDQPAAFIPNLAKSLYNLSVGLAELGYQEQALSASREALELYRQLAKDQPILFTPDLARSLKGVSIDLSILGYHEDALIAIREAVDIQRELAKDQSNVRTFNLAESIHSLSFKLSKLGRHEEALAASSEALDLRRRLANEEPDVYTSDLAYSLNSHSVRLTNLGHYEEAFAVTREAVDLYRQLAGRRPIAFNEYLAMSLYNLSLDFSKFGHHEEALAAGRQATVLFRELAKARPRVFSRELEYSLGSLAKRLETVHRTDQAAEVREELRVLRERAEDSRK